MPAQRRAVGRPAIFSTASIGAPTRGWNVRDNIANMKPEDAILLDNFFPNTSDVMLRKGFTRFATGFPAAVQTVMAYQGFTNNKLFAISSGSIYDITNGGAIGAAIGKTPQAAKAGAAIGAQAGGRSGSFSAGSAVEFGAEYPELVKEELLTRGWGPTVDNIRKLQDDDTFFAKASQLAAVKALTLNAVDQGLALASGKIGAKGLVEGAGAGRKMAAAAGSTALEALGEPTSEGVGQLAQTVVDPTRTVDASELGAEFIYSVPSSVAMAAGSTGLESLRPQASPADVAARALAQDVDSATWVPGSAEQEALRRMSPDNAQYTQISAPAVRQAPAPSATPSAVAGEPPKTLAEAAGLPKVTPQQQPERVKWKSPDGIDYPVTVVNPDIETDDGGRAALVNYNGVEMLASTLNSLPTPGIAVPGLTFSLPLSALGRKVIFTPLLSP